MADDKLKALVSQGLGALKSGGEMAAKAAGEIQNDASNPDLKAQLQQGSEVSKTWAERIERARQQTGGGAQTDNPVMEAQYEVSRRIRQAAPDDTSRDLGIIANGQLVLHYWVAAFGTMANYTQQLGLDDAAREMKSSADEAKDADQTMTQLAERILQTA